MSRAGINQLALFINFSGCLTAKRMQLKRQCQELSEDLESARMNRDKLRDALEEENREIELQM